MTSDKLSELLKVPTVKSRAGTRQDRSYLTQKRGNFHGKDQDKARENLKELARSVRYD